jgi:SAM-dependent methyltransferase
MTDRPADVPSPIDFLSATDAEAWASAAMGKRPYREELFRRLVGELSRLRSVPSHVLEIGSGPGFLAQRILAALPLVEYTALDFSPAMHVLARRRLQSLGARARFVEADFRVPDWSAGLKKYEAVVTLQAVHELRHKRHAVHLYRAVRERLLPGGVFLMCDHFHGDGGLPDAALYMTPEEHEQALRDAGFATPTMIHRHGSLVLYRAEVTCAGC